MKLYDITLALDENLPGWPDHDSYELKYLKEIEKGDRCNLCEIKTSTHFGTHIDAPGHYVDGGKKLVDLDLDLLIGDVLVIEVEGSENIKVSDLEGKVPDETRRLIVKTANSDFIGDDVFHEEYQSFTPEAMSWLLKKGVKLLGIDYFSIAPFNDLIEPHEIFLGAGDTIALEGVDLREVKPGNYELICLPIKIAGAYGAPVRAVLRK